MYHQWRKVTIWCPLLIFLPPPTIFLLSPKKRKKEKKGRHFFSVFLIGFFPPWSFLYPQIFFSRPPNAKLAEIWSILLPRRTIFRLKNSKLVICRPPKVPPPCIAGVAGVVVTPLCITNACWCAGCLRKSRTGLRFWVPWPYHLTNLNFLFCVWLMTP